MLWQKKLSRKLKKEKLLKIKPGVFSHSYWFTKFINKLMQKGRKAAVEKIVFRVFKKIKKKFNKDALKIIFFILIKNRPLLGLASARIRGEKKNVPIPLSPRKQLVLSLKWFVVSIKFRRHRWKNISVEKILYMQLKAILQKEKNMLLKRRVDHVKELVQNRVHLNFRKKIKK